MTKFTLTQFTWIATYCNYAYHTSPNLNYSPIDKLHCITLTSPLVKNCVVHIWIERKKKKFKLYDTYPDKNIFIDGSIASQSKLSLFGVNSVISMLMLEWLPRDAGVTFSDSSASVHTKSWPMDCISCWPLGKFWCTPYFYQICQYFFFQMSFI